SIYSMNVWTGTRVPAKHGVPPITSGSETTTFAFMLALSMNRNQNQERWLSWVRSKVSRRSADLQSAVSWICNPHRFESSRACTVFDRLPNAIRRYSAARQSRNQNCDKRLRLRLGLRKFARCATISTGTDRLQICATTAPLTDAFNPPSCASGLL